jgi:DUF1680 family protein
MRARFLPSTGVCPAVAVALAMAFSLRHDGFAAGAGRGIPVVPDKGPLKFQSSEGATFKFEGVLGRRIDANISQWLLRAPQANPGMLEMFRVRDRLPAPQLVPWAGEFVGKYLISAIQALRMSEDPALRVQVRQVIADLIATQAEDGYLGPFPKASRLRGNWDLWGHYHCMQALMLWHQATGDKAALNTCRRAADLVCHTYLDSPRRVFDAGSHEMNMAIIHALGELHRLTGEPRYLRMTREIEKDWERAGDYFRTGLSGTDFFLTARPRWESIHDLQGLVELYRITGDGRYRTAFEHHWRSIVRWDRHNTGGFSSGEQATGNPYSPSAIETCCTIAWMAMTIDQLRLTGDPLCADELELSTFNGAVGAQHPSGRWWTYNTPMDGVREASAHSIVFQARAGTPELNCCSVNAPRSLGMLSDWAVMNDERGLVLNHYGPGRFEGRLVDTSVVALRCETDYPLAGRVRVRVETRQGKTFPIQFRIPAWSRTTAVWLNGQPVPDVVAGRYLELSRRWKASDTIELEFDLTPRFVTGDREAAGKVSLYRGPLLLAYDQRHNAFDEDAIPALDLKRLSEIKVISSLAGNRVDSVLNPWLLVELPASHGRAIRLCDFASAGAAGTRYRSWLTAENCPPPPAVTRVPGDGATLPPGPAVFKWTGPRRTNSLLSGYQLLIAEKPDFTAAIIATNNLRQNRVVLEESVMRRLTAGRPYFWKVTSANAHGITDGTGPFARFTIDPGLPPAAPERLAAAERADGLLVRAALRGGVQAEIGRLKEPAAHQSVAGPRGEADGAVEVDGKSQRIGYLMEEFPEDDFALTLRCRFTELPAGRLGQIFSAWAGPMDDPLRLCVDKGKLFARIEAGQGYGTSGFPVETGRWYAMAVVKAGSQLTLFVDGKPVSSVTVPMFVRSNARDFALGGNPHFGGNEFLAAQFSDLAFYARALSKEEISTHVKPE